MKENILNQKQLRWVKAYLESGNASQAAIDAGYCAQHGGRMLKNAKVLEYLQKLRNKSGFSDEELMEKHRQLLNAKKIQSCQIFVRKENGKMVLNRNSDDFIEVDDNNTQLGALKLACQIDNKIKEYEKEKGPGSGGVIIQIFNFGANGKPKENTVAGSRVSGIDQPMAN